MKTCIKCEEMRIVPIEDGCGATAKCFMTSKRGKTITWAMTAISFQTMIREEGEDRVIANLKAKKKPPFWCPKKKSNS